MNDAPRSGPRSWRNRNPGNLRPVTLPDKWVGEIDLDRAAGGPFSIFDRDAHGWRALCKVLVNYQAKYGLTSVKGMLYRYAPPVENDTDAYVARVCGALKVAPDDTVKITEWRVMRQMLLAIAAHEGGRECPTWPDAPMVEGMLLAGLKP